MKNFIGVIVAGAAFFGCQQNKNESNNTDAVVAKDSVITIAKSENPGAKDNSLNTAYTSVALRFINGYVEDCNKMNESKGVVEWVTASPDATANLKHELKALVDKSYEEDPEMGLDADPIFDAQDYPDAGFEVVSTDEKTGYVVVKGINWKEFTLTMKLVNENGKWLVDGCGVINIPVDKRRKV